MELRILRAPTYVAAYQPESRLEIFTTSPVCGASTNWSFPMYIPTWSRPLKKTMSPGCELVARNGHAVVPHRVGRMRQRDAHLRVRPHHEPGAVEAAGSGAAPDIRRVQLRHRVLHDVAVRGRRRDELVVRCDRRDAEAGDRARMRPAARGTAPRPAACKQELPRCLGCDELVRSRPEWTSRGAAPVPIFDWISALAAARWATTRDCSAFACFRRTRAVVDRRAELLDLPKHACIR